MDNLSLLKDGTVIMCLGMGFVFLFLVIMVYSMNIMAFVIKKLNNIFPEEVQNEIKYSKKGQSSSDSDVALVIALAYAKSQES